MCKSTTLGHVLSRTSAAQFWVSLLLATFGITMALGARKMPIPPSQEHKADMLQQLPDGSPTEARHAKHHSLSALHWHLLPPWCSALPEPRGS